jgi:hypothetical protein
VGRVLSCIGLEYNDVELLIMLNNLCNTIILRDGEAFPLS